MTFPLPISSPPPPGDDDYPPLSALNDLLFCPRRCFLHRVEGLWVETAHTVEGTHAHRNAHAPGGEGQPGRPRLARGLWLKSDRLRLAGVADVVEFHPNPAGGPDVPYPVEYKRGQRRRWDNDEVQLCAQALCLEEMIGVPVPAGAVFSVKSRRRREVAFHPALRRATEDAAGRLHALLAAQTVPPPVPHPKCRACSLNGLCLPEIVADRAAYQRAACALFVAPPL
jgi:CRISPR-associated exonuclease Cas4